MGRLVLKSRHRLMCGDSTKPDSLARLMDGAQADFCFTSPPYNAAMTAKQVHSKAPKQSFEGFYGAYSDDLTPEEYVEMNRAVCLGLASVASPDFVCCWNMSYNRNSPSAYIDVVQRLNGIFPLAETVVWEKQMAVSLTGHNLTRIVEFIFIFCAGELRMNKAYNDCVKNLWKISNIGANTDQHKAAFPVALVQEAIALFCKQDSAIVEPFGGTGTVLLAAHIAGHRSYTMELDPRYVDAAVKRFEQYTGERAVLWEN